MHSLLQWVMEATVVAKAVLVVLLLLSVGSWAYMAGKWRELRATRRRVCRGVRRLARAESLEQAFQGLAGDPASPLFVITEGAVREFNRINKTGDAQRLLEANVRRALRYGIEEEMARLKASMALLATTASVAPFIGLFGTVWGIMHSFQSISQMKNVSLAVVAPGIAEALIATAVGLFVAIPATCGYNIFRARISFIEGRCVTAAGQLLNFFQHEAHCHPQGMHFGEEKHGA